MSGSEKIAEMLSSDIPKDFLLALDALFHSALERVTAAGATAARGHRAHVIGCNRHFALNEAMDATLTEFEIPHAPLRGNGIVSAGFGRVTLARLHKNKGPWSQARRSAAKRALSEKNRDAAKLVQPDFISGDVVVAELTCFLVTEHDGALGDPGQIYLMVPDGEMNMGSPLFLESLQQFLQRYESVDEIVDNAKPTLKKGVIKKADDER